MTKKQTKNKTKKNKRSANLKYLQFLIITLIVIASASIIIMIYRQHQPDSALATITINNVSFHAEIANTEETRRYGLMLREKLPEKTGMLFIFDSPAIQSFWMKNTLISLDIIFIDAEKKILSIHTMPPNTEQSCHSISPALYVLELTAGSANRYNLKPGQIVEITLPNAK